MAFYLLAGCSFLEDEDGRMDNGALRDEKSLNRSEPRSCFAISWQAF